MPNFVNFFVPGKPAPQGSKKHVGRGILVESSKEVGPWRERVALAAHSAGARLAEKPKPVYLVVEYILPRPTSTPKTKTPPATKRPDRDKLDRAIGDALTGIAYQDDSQVVAGLSWKRLADPGETPGANIQIYY